MSFATDLKDELCKDVPEQESAIHALLYGFLLFSHKFSADEISFANHPMAVYPSGFLVCQLWASRQMSRRVRFVFQFSSRFALAGSA